MIIDVGHSFTDDLPNYWEHFPEHLEDIDDFDKCKTLLIDYLIALYGNKTLPNNKKFTLEYKHIKGYNNINLCGNDIRYGSDSIINIYWYWTRPAIIKNLIDYEVKNFVKYKTGLNFYDFIQKYIKTAYTIGGHMIFPKLPSKYSINVKRCFNNYLIRDRFDLTLECIRRYYIYLSDGTKLKNPLFDIFEFETNKKYFKMFSDFKGYVDFFFLNSLVDKNYNFVKLFIDNSDNFNNDALPKNKEEWWTLYEKQQIFLMQRNNDINNLVCRMQSFEK